MSDTTLQNNSAIKGNIFDLGILNNIRYIPNKCLLGALFSSLANYVLLQKIKCLSNNDFGK